MVRSVENIIQGAKIIPVIVIEDADTAIPLAECLVENGLPIVEVTLRTEAAFEAIELIVKNVPECKVGVGSILDESQLERSQAIGASFGVSPGTSPKLLEAIIASNWPFLPGAGSVSEVMSLRESGFSFQKLFPASILGGVGFLKALGAPVSDVSFCPTGGISYETAEDFLSLENVFAIGGSWIAPSNLVVEKNWSEIASRAKQAAELASKFK